MALLTPGYLSGLRYAPAVLLLRRFGALTKSLAGGGQDQPKTVSLIGAALREGIHAHLEHDQEEDHGSRDEYENGIESEDQLTLDQGLQTTKVW